jgi:hypothetical protein
MATIEELARRAMAHGLSPEAALAEAQLMARIQPPPPATPVEPKPAHDWTQYDLNDAHRRAAFDRAFDPLRASQAAAQRDRIEAQRRPLIEQRDALNRQIAQLNEEYQRWM